MEHKARDYKMDISMLNDEQRAKLQRTLFNAGYTWGDIGKGVKNISASYLFLSSNMDMTSHSNKKLFNRNKNSTLLASYLVPKGEVK